MFNMISEPCMAQHVDFQLAHFAGLILELIDIWFAWVQATFLVGIVDESWEFDSFCSLIATKKSVLNVLSHKLMWFCYFIDREVFGHELDAKWKKKHKKLAKQKKCDLIHTKCIGWLTHMQLDLAKHSSKWTNWKGWIGEQ